MTKALRLADELGLPVELVTQTIAVLAKRRAGKSYLCARLVEELFAAGEQVVILDPKGDWWGLRSSADGKSEGLSILILGGEHGDLPLEPGSGEAVARLVVEDRVSALVDLSSLRKHEVATFSAHFLETLYRLKAKEQFRTPVMLVVDEADAIAPQNPYRGGDEFRMLGAIEDVVRRGGQRGIGCIMATQRTAVLNKNVLTQAQVMIALRTIAPQDLAAMNAWIDVHGSPKERKTLMESLPSLPVGTAWIWSPGWPTEKGIFQRVEVSARKTFDSGATPRPGEKRKAPKTLADVDLAAVKKTMADVIERQKADDPKLLKKRIADLEHELGAKPVPLETERVEVPVFDEDAFSKLRKSIEGNFEAIGMSVSLAVNSARTALSNYRAICAEQAKAPKIVATVAKRSAAPPMHQNASPRTNHHQQPPRVVDGRTGEAPTLGNGGDRVMLAAAAQHRGGVTREQLTVLTGYKRSSRDTFIQRLKAAGFLEGGDRLTATADGREALGPDFEPLPTGAALRRHWLERLPEGERRVLEVLVEAFPKTVSRDEISEKLGYKHTSRDSFLQRLGARRLVETPARGEARASEELF